jgi:anti-anti-sigma factor
VPGTLEVENHAPNVAIVAVRGEHDLTTKPALAEALARASDHLNVLVDLSECPFMDSSLIGALVEASSSLARFRRVRGSYLCGRRCRDDPR